MSTRKLHTYGYTFIVIVTYFGPRDVYFSSELLRQGKAKVLLFNRE